MFSKWNIYYNRKRNVFKVKWFEKFYIIYFNNDFYCLNLNSRLRQESRGKIRTKCIEEEINKRVESIKTDIEEAGEKLKNELFEMNKEILKY